MTKPNIDLNDFSAAELRQLSQAVAHRLIEKRNESIRIVRAKIMAMVAEEGLSLDEVLRGPDVKQKFQRGVRYQHPTDQNVTWVCRGSRPAWVQHAIESGTILERVPD